jgi:hypothetical protein
MVPAACFGTCRLFWFLPLMVPAACYGTCSLLWYLLLVMVLYMGMKWAEYFYGKHSGSQLKWSDILITKHEYLI